MTSEVKKRPTLVIRPVKASIVTDGHGFTEIVPKERKYTRVWAM